MLKLFLKKEWMLWWANPVHFIIPFLFAFIVMTLFGILWEPPSSHQKIITSLFVTLLFAGVLRFIKGSDPENESSLFLYYKQFPQTALPLFISKLLMNSFYLILLFIVSYLTILFYMPLESPFGFCFKMAPLFALWLLGFSLLGTVFSGMLMGYEKRDAVLPLLLYPFTLPIMVGLLKGFSFSESGGIITIEVSWIYFMALFDGIYLFLCLYIQELLWDA